MKSRDLLWYRQPAKKWIEALPLGNGRLGAMVYGRDLEERIQIDESSFWSGAPSEHNNRSDTKELLWKIRKLLLEGNYEEADRIGHDFVGIKNNYGTNMPVGDLILTLTGINGEAVSCTDSETEYQERSLNLKEAVAKTSFLYKGLPFQREVFVSNPAQVLCVRFLSEDGCLFDLNIRYDGIGNDTSLCGEEENTYLIRGNAFETLHSDGKSGAHLQGAAKLLTDGTHYYEKGTVFLKNATYLVLLLDLQTDMFEKDPLLTAKEHVEEAAKAGFDVLKKLHRKDVKPFYERMDLVLGKEDHTDIPTDVRIQKMIEGDSDPGLIAQLFQYGRYVLLASSREDSPLPTHMGGIWNDNIYNHIDCTQDMHIDMNLEMQYWLAAQCSLPESYSPLFRYIRNILVPSGQKTAKEDYGAGGWSAHLVTNPWGFTSLGWSYNWGVWTLGGVWCTTLLWDYYEYTLDQEFLKEFAYPIIKGAAEFVLDYVFYDEKSGYYMTGPSYSPENMFRTEGKDYFLSLSATCDIIMVREMLHIMINTVEALGTGEEELKERCREVLSKLPWYQIGGKGQIQEWFYDFEEPNPGHRHTSHLLGLYPFCQIDPDAMPELAKGAKKSIALRYEDFEVTSWGYAMLIGYSARLRDGEKALSFIRDTVKKILKPSMASVMSDETSMWCGTWEIDGNTGLTAAIGEMLLQSQGGVIRILPALPSEWSDGSLKGICIRGGHSADITWQDQKPVKVVIHGGSNERREVVFGGQRATVELKKGEDTEVVF